MQLEKPHSKLCTLEKRFLRLYPYVYNQTYHISLEISIFVTQISDNVDVVRCGGTLVGVMEDLN